MKLNPLLLLAAAGAGFYYFRNTIRTAKNVTYQFDGIFLTEANLKGIKGYIKIKLFNPDKGIITLNQIAGTISAEGTNAVNFSSEKGATLQPNTTTTAIVNYQISLANLAFAAIPIVQKIINREALSFEVNGFIDTNVGRITFEKTFNTRGQ